jgi:GTP pyrophosphokinase
VEFQLRTEAMHLVAESGVAAHWLYKSHDTSEKAERLGTQWLQSLLDIQDETRDATEFWDHVKVDLFPDAVYVFTPKSHIMALPRGATVVDFAYAVHTDVGNHAVGAKINGRIAPLLSELQNGDEVEIAVAEGQVPPAAWETLVVTGKARAAIRRATRDAVRSQYAGLGRQIVTRAFERAKKTFSDEKLKGALPRLARQSIDDVLAAVGRGEMFSGDVVKAVHPDFKEERKANAGVHKANAGMRKADTGWFGLKKAASLVFKVPGAEGPPDAHAIPIRGLGGDLPVSFAPNGGAVPGDRIVGILTPGEGITIYPIQSPALMDFDDQPERWLDVRWDLDENEDLFPAQIVVNAMNEPGALGSIATVIGEEGGNIDHIEFVDRTSDFRDIVLDLQVRDLKHLNMIIGNLKAQSVVSKVERVNG